MSGGLVCGVWCVGEEVCKCTVVLVDEKLGKIGERFRCGMYGVQSVCYGGDSRNAWCC